MDNLIEAKDSPSFSFKDYVHKTYDVKEAQFLVWLLDKIEAKTPKIKPHAKWIVQNIMEIKDEGFIRKHLSEDTILRGNLVTAPDITNRR